MSKNRQKSKIASTQNNNHPAEIVVEKYRLYGTLLTALIGLIGVIITAYFGYKGLQAKNGDSASAMPTYENSETPTSTVKSSALSQLDGLILDMAFDGNEKQIYTISPDGSNKKQLTFLGANTEPAWSPDGQKILFLSTRDGNHDIYLMDADGSNQINLTQTPFEEFGFSWAPNGKEIAYSANIDGDSDVWIMDSVGNNKLNLTQAYNSSNEAYPSWSSDGSKLAFSLYRDGDQQIYTMNKDGSDIKVVTDLPNQENYSPVWSNDNESICFYSKIDDVYKKYKINLANNELSEISLTQWESICSYQVGRGRISPNGNYQVVLTKIDNYYQLFIWSLDGTSKTRITNDSLNWQIPNWQPRP